MSSHGSRGAQLGFTLLEVVVAVALLGIFLGAAFELLALGLRSARASGDTTQRILLARQKVDELSVQLKAGSFQGEGGAGYRWVGQVLPEAAALQNAGGGSAGAGEGELAGLYQIKLRVLSPGGDRRKGLELTTMGVAFDDGSRPFAGGARSTRQVPTSGGSQMPQGQMGAGGTIR